MITLSRSPHMATTAWQGLPDMNPSIRAAGHGLRFGYSSIISPLAIKLIRSFAVTSLSEYYASSTMVFPDWSRKSQPCLGLPCGPARARGTAAGLGQTFGMLTKARGREPVGMRQGRRDSKQAAPARMQARHQQPLPFQVTENHSSRLIPESLKILTRRSAPISWS